MKVSENNLKILMLAIHQYIEENAEFISEKLNNGDSQDLLNYPPNCGFSDDEKDSLEKIKNDQNLKSALRKIFADNSADVIFNLMNLFDGTTSPDENLGDWSELTLIDKTNEIDEPEDMLHDYFFETYWDWKKIRNNSDWKLDTYG